MKALKLLRNGWRDVFTKSYSVPGRRICRYVEGNLYKGIVAFMVVGLKKSIPYITQAIPEVTCTGQWLSEKIAENIKNLALVGLYVV